jgi:PAS domain S-box-containing protein
MPKKKRPNTKEIVQSSEVMRNKSMPNRKISSDQEAVCLRKRAENRARKKAAEMPKTLEALTPGESRKLVHELRVHQIELEMQNEELRRVQEELEASRARYFDMYDMAPAGYVIVSEKGLVLEANFAAANLLGMARSDLVMKPFSSFVVREDRDTYSVRFKQLLETKEPQSYELRILCKDGSHFWAQIATTAALHPDGTPLFRTVLSDITECKNERANLVEEELRYLSRKVILAQEEERKRLSHELHDSLGQKIIAMQLEIQWLKNCECENADKKDVYENMVRMTMDASDELQRICLGLRPIILDRIGFNAAIKALLEEFETSSDIVISAKITPVDETHIGSDTTISLYRILQEALSNVVRHAKAKKAFVTFREEGSELVLEVKDEGCGLAGDASLRKHGFGILGMAKRANMCGGRFEINSPPGKGTHIRVSVPAINPFKETGI